MNCHKSVCYNKTIRDYNLKNMNLLEIMVVGIILIMKF